MTIVRCDATHATEWDAFVQTSPDASFYHRFAWKAVNESSLGHRTAFLGAMDGSRLTGVMPLVQVKSVLFGNIACSLPFVNYGGPCAADPDVERQLMKEAARVCEEWGVDYLEIRSRRLLAGDLPVAEHKVSLTLDLQQDPDALWTKFKTDHRKDIRRGYKNGLVARFGGIDLLDPFYEVLTESWHQLGTPLYQKAYFRAVLEAFPAECRICVVYAGDDPAGAAFDGHHRDTVEGMWLGSKLKYRNSNLGYVLYWEVIKDACERGYARFHLGRSTANSNSETFKKKWNATPTQLYWHYVMHKSRAMPQLNKENPKFRRASDLWRRLPPAVVRRLGPHIARSIP